MSEEAEDFRTLKSIAALAGKEVLAQWTYQGTIQSAYITPGNDDESPMWWCYSLSAMPYSNKSGLYKLSRNEFIVWFDFYCRYCGFMTPEARSKILSRSPPFHRSGSLPLTSADQGPNPLQLLSQGLARR